MLAQFILKRNKKKHTRGLRCRCISSPFHRHCVLHGVVVAVVIILVVVGGCCGHSTPPTEGATVVVVGCCHEVDMVVEVVVAICVIYLIVNKLEC